MSEFSDYIYQKLKMNRITITDLATQCEIDRSSMYKIVKGTRPSPSIKVVLKMAKVLRLNTLEKEHLIDLFMKDKMGSDDYQIHKQIKEMLHYEKQKDDLALQAVVKNKPEDYKSVAVLNGARMVKYAFLDLINAEAREGTPHLKIYTVVMNSTFILLIENVLKDHSKIQIDCVSGLQAVSSAGKDGLFYNLTVLDSAMKLSEYKQCSFRYLYDHDAGKCEFSFAQPNVVIGTNIMLTFSNDLKRGFIYTDQEVIKKYMEAYKDLMVNTHPLLDIISERGSMLKELETNENAIINTLNCQLPSLRFMTVVQKYKKTEDSIVYDSEQKVLYTSDKYIKKRVIYGLNSLENWMQGKNDAFLIAKSDQDMSLNDRKEWVKKFLNRMETVNVQFLNENLFHSGNQPEIYILPTCAILVQKSKNGDERIFRIEESSLVIAFNDYINALWEYGSFFYEKEEISDRLGFWQDDK